MVESSAKRTSLKPGHELIRRESSNAVHSFGDDERIEFSQLINMNFSSDPDLSDLLPINPNSEELFTKVENGLILCKMINKAVPGTIDERAINKKKPLNIFQMKENLNLAINSGQSIGCIIINISPQLILDKREHIILGFVWQIFKTQYIAKINLKNHPDLIVLKEKNEELNDILKLSSEALLLRWINYHLKRGGSSRVASNFNTDLQDAEIYTVLLNQLDSKLCDLAGLSMPIEKRAEKVVADSKQLKVESAMCGKDITTGNAKVNMLFCAQIFNTCPGLEKPPEEVRKEAAVLLNDDESDSREERTFRLWLNSLGATPGADFQINNLYEDLKDGLVLLKVLHILDGSLVDWKKACMKPDNKFKKLQNTNLAVQYGKDMKFSLVGIGGPDITDGKKKLVLAFVWQLMRKNVLDLLGDVSEEQLLNWANERVTKAPKIASFKDPNLKSGLFLLHLISSLDKEVVDWKLVTEGVTDDEIQKNAGYAISCTRKIGVTSFIVWEDVKELRQKMIMVFVAALADFYKVFERKRSRTMKV